MKNNKLIKTILTLMLYVLVLSNLLQANTKTTISLTKEEREYTKTNTVKVGVSNWVPINFSNDDITHQGIISDILKHIHNSTGLRFEIQYGTWDSLIQKIKNKEIDLLPDTHYTKERANFGLYSKGYLKIKHYVYVKDTNKKIKSLKDLNHKKIAIVKSFGTIPLLKEKFPNIKIVETSSLDDSINMVLNAEVDALYESQIVVEHKINDELIVGLKGISQIVLKPPYIHMFSKRDDLLLQSILQKGLDTISLKKKQQIVGKWINTQQNKKGVDFTSEQMTYLRNKNSVKLCVDPAWLPFEGVKDGKHTGMAKEFIDIFEENIQIPIQIVKTDNWTESLEFIKQRKCDILSFAAKTDNREKYLNFTKPFVFAHLVIATKNDESFSADIENIIANKKLAIIKGHASFEMLNKKYPLNHIQEVQSLDVGLKMVESGEIYGFIGSMISIGSEIQKEYFKILKISAKLDEKMELGTAVRSDDKILFDIFNKMVDNIDSPTKQTILNKWISIVYEKPMDYTIVWQILFIFFLIIIVVVYHQSILYSINKKLNKKYQDELKKSQEKDRIVFAQNKLASMGEMIENIAHQWRQPLAGINSSVMLIDKKISKHKVKDISIEKELDSIEGLTQYLSMTIDDFKNFYKKNKVKTTFYLYDAIDKALFITSGTFKTNEIEIENKTDKKIQLYNYSNELQQVLLSILLNAKDVLIEQKMNNRQVKIITFKESSADEAVIQIYDNGGGIKEDNLEKIFEPYFTTKYKTQGTGIGLYMAKVIIEQSMRGTLSVKNNSEGACFEIRLKNNEK